VGGRLQCFAILASGHLGQSTLKGTTWSAWVDRGGALKRKPSCVTPDGSRIVCVALGADGRLHERDGVGATWSAWETLGGSLRFTHPPTCYARANGVDCVAADQRFRGQFLRRAANGRWSAAQSLGGTVDDVPSCIAPNATTRTCFFKGTDTSLRRIFFSGTAWSGWENLRGAMSSAPSCTLLGASPHCYAVFGTALQERRYRNPLWEPWTSLGGSLRALRPSCLATRGTRIDCFGLSTGGNMAHAAYF
jgi:hypothetical protein